MVYLVNVSYTRDELIDSTNEEGSDLIRLLKKRVPSVTFNKMVRIVSEGIASVRPSKSSQLVWTKSAVLFGHKSMRPKCEVDYLWDKIIGAVGDDKECLFVLGALVRWQTAVHAEKTRDIWLMYRQETGGVDPITGKTIHENHYWIDNNYTFSGDIPKTKSQLASPATTLDFEALATKFRGGRV